MVEKSDERDRFLILVNVRNEEKTVGVPEPWVKREGTDLMGNRDIDLEKQITLMPFEYLILRR